MYCPGVFYLKIAFFPKSRAEENTRKTPLLRNGSVERRIMRTGLKKRDKTTEIYFDEASPVIEIHTHNTDLKKRLTENSRRYPDLCKQTDEDAEQGYKAFEIRKGRFSFRLTAPYSDLRRRAASEAAKIHSGNLKHAVQKYVL